MFHIYLKEFDTCNAKDKHTIVKYFEAFERSSLLAVKMLIIESSIQLSYNIGKLLLESRDPSLKDLSYSSLFGIVDLPPNGATARWILVNFVIFAIKILMSGFFTFKPLMLLEKVKSHKIHKKSPSILTYVSLLIRTIFEIALAVITLFTERLYSKFSNISKQASRKLAIYTFHRLAEMIVQTRFV